MSYNRYYLTPFSNPGNYSAYCGKYFDKQYKVDKCECIPTNYDQLKHLESSYSNRSDVHFVKRCPGICDAVEKCNDNINQNVVVTNLVANTLTSARFFDPTLSNAIGVITIGDTIWATARRSGAVNRYNLDGSIAGSPIGVRDLPETQLPPTGIVQNTTTGFAFTNGVFTPLPAVWLVATSFGTINAYNPLIDPLSALVVIDSSTVENAIYTGLTIADNKLYVTDFKNNRINVFDQNFNLISNIPGAFPFIDQNFTNPLPSDYAPINIAFINGELYVTYAKQLPPQNEDVISGVGNGYINVFTVDGQFVRRFASRGPLNIPYGIVRAPGSFAPTNNQCKPCCKEIKKYLNNDGPYGNCCSENIVREAVILVGNVGDGYIDIFSEEGLFLGRLKNCNGSDVRIDGVWGLASAYYFNGVTDESNTAFPIYFAAGPNNEQNGLVGVIRQDCNINDNRNCCNGQTNGVKRY